MVRNECGSATVSNVVATASASFNAAGFGRGRFGTNPVQLSNEANALNHPSSVRLAVPNNASDQQATGLVRPEPRPEPRHLRPEALPRPHVLDHRLLH